MYVVGILAGPEMWGKKISPISLFCFRQALPPPPSPMQGLLNKGEYTGGGRREQGCLQ